MVNSAFGHLLLFLAEFVFKETVFKKIKDWRMIVLTPCLHRPLPFFSSFFSLSCSAPFFCGKGSFFINLLCVRTGIDL